MPESRARKRETRAVRGFVATPSARARRVFEAQMRRAVGGMTKSGAVPDV